jgi:hypothetical protein
MCVCVCVCVYCRLVIYIHTYMAIFRHSCTQCFCPLEFLGSNGDLSALGLLNVVQQGSVAQSQDGAVCSVKFFFLRVGV